VTALDIARHAFVGWPYVLIAAIALPLALWTKVHPILLLLAGAGAGMAIGLLSDA